jgi:hypothetical protein
VLIIHRFGLLMVLQGPCMFCLYLFFFLYIHLIFLLHLSNPQANIPCSIWYSLLQSLSTEIFIWLVEFFISRSSIWVFQVFYIFTESLSYLALFFLFY